MYSPAISTICTKVIDRESMEPLRDLTNFAAADPTRKRRKVTFDLESASSRLDFKIPRYQVTQA